MEVVEGVVEVDCTVAAAAAVVKVEGAMGVGESGMDKPCD